MTHVFGLRYVCAMTHVFGLRNVCAMTHVFCLRHVGDDAVGDDEEDEVLAAVAVLAGEVGHVLDHGSEVGRPIQLNLRQTSLIRLHHSCRSDRHTDTDTQSASALHHSCRHRQTHRHTHTHGQSASALHHSCRHRQTHRHTHRHSHSHSQ